MKIPRLLASIFLLSSSLHAYANGFYVGAGGGYDITNFYKTLTIVEGNTNVYNKEDNLTGTGFFGSALLGYEFNLGKAFFIDTQLDGNLSQLKYNGWYTNSTAGEYSTGTFTIHKSYGVSLLPGYYFNKNVGLYGRIGYKRGDFNYSEYKQDDSEPITGISEDQWLNGLLLGLGTTIPITKHIALRFEYDHIWYETFTNTTFPIPGRTINLTPNSNLIQLDAIYRF